MAPKHLRPGRIHRRLFTCSSTSLIWLTHWRCWMETGLLWCKLDPTHTGDGEIVKTLISLFTSSCNRYANNSELITHASKNGQHRSHCLLNVSLSTICITWWLNHTDEGTSKTLLKTVFCEGLNTEVLKHKAAAFLQYKTMANGYLTSD